MNVVKVMGGLGNQMFQYAFARKMDAKLDLSFYDSSANRTRIIPRRSFLLDKFNCKYQIADKETISLYVTENDYLEDREYTDTYFDGYWQKPSLYKDFYYQLRNELTLKDEYINSEMKDICGAMLCLNSCAVHVRRTDYVNLDHDLDLSYYESAINSINERHDDVQWFIFSDDIEWCEYYLPIKYRTFCHFEDYQDLWLMSHAKYFIASNSTFSFWGQYLSKTKKEVVFPHDWCGVPSLLNENGGYL